MNIQFYWWNLLFVSVNKLEVTSFFLSFLHTVVKIGHVPRMAAAKCSCLRAVGWRPGVSVLGRMLLGPTISPRAIVLARHQGSRSWYHGTTGRMGQTPN